MTMCWHLLGNSLLAAAPGHTCEYNQLSEDLQSHQDWEGFIPDYQCALNNHSLTAEAHKNLDDVSFQALRRLFVFNNATSAKECRQVNYNSYTDNWRNGKRSQERVQKE
ncbi:Oidioi.mRNA.OKI2018_I69.chr2.g4137.t1.cds [Oikopleura dioica]|uniref:Oidioi.mRNA.OKI2018_I69.chr2.g4137.t1.cds n=1 Tax=Oikopleura dioica TaxID=34765 RepID=A0ABN7T2T2_OIKDI|nr:Oidioi.mRNA.OKI2018_I69.chr2.g4137.t1.cds [Oikopleura dioica]